MKPPAFQFYPDNFRDGVADFTQEEIGAYMMLLCYQWSHGAIPKDRARMERAACGHVSEHVLRKFPVGQDGELRNERLEREREKQTAYRESRAINGAKGGRPKAHGLHMDLKTEPKHEAKKSSPSPSPSSSPIITPNPIPSLTPPPKKTRAPRAALPPLECEAFRKFWNAYPNRKAIANAEKAWVKNGCSEKIESILSAIESLKSSPQWTKEGGEYIPHPATWLNARGWEDEVKVSGINFRANGNSRPPGYENWKSMPLATDPVDPPWGTQGYIRKHGHGI